MADQLSFPKLDLTEWQSTRDTVHIYSRLLGKIRQAMTPPLEKWWHISLHVSEVGLTTTDIPLADGDHFSLALDLVDHNLVIDAPNGDRQIISLKGHSPNSMMHKVLASLKVFGAKPDIDQSIFASTEIGDYTPSQASTFFSALHNINTVFTQFKGSLPGKTGPVQLWPHHFDLAVEWFSGREADVPEGEEGGDEQIGFGFATGDEGIESAYFYANPWPFPDGITDTPLPTGSHWFTDSWRGGLLRYDTLTASDEPEAMLMAYLQAVHQNASALMR